MYLYQMSNKDKKGSLLLLLDGVMYRTEFMISIVLSHVNEKVENRLVNIVLLLFVHLMIFLEYIDIPEVTISTGPQGNPHQCQGITSK